MTYHSKVKDDSTVLYYFKIEVFKSGSIQVEQLFWNDLPFYIRTKYDWYFEYRAALLRIKYPRYRHSITMGSYPKETKDIIKIMERRLKKAIARVSITERNLELYRLMYRELFPIEDDPDYQKALQVLDNKRENVNKIKKELNQLNNESLHMV